MLNDNVEDIDNALEALQNQDVNPYNELTAEQYEESAYNDYQYHLSLINNSKMDETEKNLLRKLELDKFKKRKAESDFHRSIPKKKMIYYFDDEQEVWNF